MGLYAMNLKTKSISATELDSLRRRETVGK